MIRLFLLFFVGEKIKLDIVFFFATFYLLIQKAAPISRICPYGEYRDDEGRREENVCKEKMNVKPL